MPLHDTCPEAGRRLAQLTMLILWERCAVRGQENKTLRRAVQFRGLHVKPVFSVRQYTPVRRIIHIEESKSD